MKNIMVTGADRGLGLALVKVYLEAGMNVIAGIYMEDCLKIDALKATYGERLTVIKLDISKDESVKSASKQIREQVSHLDILINNAGILGDIEKTIVDPLDLGEIQEVINVNALGPLRVVNELVDMVLQSEMKLIVNISSEAGSIGENYRDAWFGYCMSKSALNQAGALIHRRIKSQGGRVIQMHPGYMKSYMLGHFNEEAKLDTDDSAMQIMTTINAVMEESIEENALYMDLYGKKLEW